MKMFLFMITFISGCSSEKHGCEFTNGTRAVWGLRPFDCSHMKESESEAHYKKWIAVRNKGSKYRIPGKFEVIDKNSGYYKCSGTIEGYPYLSDKSVWQYFFSKLKCGNINPDGYGFFSESQLKRTGNLAD